MSSYNCIRYSYYAELSCEKTKIIMLFMKLFKYKLDITFSHPLGDFLRQCGRTSANLWEFIFLQFIRDSSRVLPIKFPFSEIPNFPQAQILIFKLNVGKRFTIAEY